MILISFHNKYISILLDVIFHELTWTEKKTLFLLSWMLLKCKQKNRMCKTFISITEVPFYSLYHHYNFIKLYQSVDSQMFRRLYADKHILSLNKAIAMRFSQNKAWYTLLYTWYSLVKNYISHLFLIFYFQRGPFFLKYPVSTALWHLYHVGPI